MVVVLLLLMVVTQWTSLSRAPAKAGTAGTAQRIGMCRISQWQEPGRRRGTTAGKPLRYQGKNQRNGRNPKCCHDPSIAIAVELFRPLAAAGCIMYLKFWQCRSIHKFRSHINLGVV